MVEEYDRRRQESLETDIIEEATEEYVIPVNHSLILFTGVN